MNEKQDCTYIKSQDFQPYPISGTLKENMDKTSQELKRLLKDFNESKDILYYYIVATLNFENGQIIQRGSGPNLQGGMISLCSCKHWMRTFSDICVSKDLWIAGLTGKNLIKKSEGNYVFYLMKVENKFKSHYDAWIHMSHNLKLKKSAAKNKFGDVFKPKSKIIDVFDPNSYKKPIKDHPHKRKDKSGNTIWHKDIIQYYYKPFVLLFGNPKYSYIWTKPKIKWKVDENLTEGQRKITIKQFLKNI